MTANLRTITTAGAVRPPVDPSMPHRLLVAARRRRVTASNGMTIAADLRQRELDDLDVAVVAALGTLTGPDPEAALDGRVGRANVRALAAVDPHRTRIAAACTGVFPVARAFRSSA